MLHTIIRNCCKSNNIKKTAVSLAKVEATVAFSNATPTACFNIFNNNNQYYSTCNASYNIQPTHNNYKNDSLNLFNLKKYSLPSLPRSTRSYSTKPFMEFNPVSKIEGLSEAPFPKEVVEKLLQPINESDIEIKPDGIIYLPEIKYRRILNAAFGPGAWVLVPTGEPKIAEAIIYREYALYCYGKFVSQAIGEQQTQAHMTDATSVESAKSNALMRCCKDIGIASELWDPEYIIKWKEQHAVSPWCKHEQKGNTKKLWRRKDRPPFGYPWSEQASGATGATQSTRSNYAKSNTTSSKPAEAASVQYAKKPAFAKEKPATAPTSNDQADDNLSSYYQSSSSAPAASTPKPATAKTTPPPPPPPPTTPTNSTSLPVTPSSGIDVTELIPKQFRRYHNKGYTWEQVLASSSGVEYLKWFSNNFEGEARGLAVQALEYLEAQKQA